MEKRLVDGLKKALKEKIERDKDLQVHQLESSELRNITSEILKDASFHVFDEPFTSSEGKKQPDAIAVNNRKLIVIEYVPSGNLAHERKMKELLGMEKMLRAVSGKEVEFWLVTTRMSEPKALDLRRKGVKVIVPTPLGSWTDEAFISH